MMRITRRISDQITACQILSDLAKEESENAVNRGDEEDASLYAKYYTVYSEYLNELNKLKDREDHVQ